jgi:hypothetical protein
LVFHYDRIEHLKPRLDGLPIFGRLIVRSVNLVVAVL